jgi:hypothetical protein
MSRAYAVCALGIGTMFAVGCATPSAFPPGTDVPLLVRDELPVAHEAIFDWAGSHNGNVPSTSIGEGIALDAIKERTRTFDELDAAGNPVEVTETIDAVAYAYRPAHEQCVLAVAGHIVRQPKGGGTPRCAWYCYRGRYTSDGVVLPDETTYFENADLFIDAMRGTSHQVAWNSSAWAINRIYGAMTASQGRELTDTLVDSFVASATATGRARVPTGMPPRQAAFGGLSNRGATGATPPSDQ